MRSGMEADHPTSPSWSWGFKEFEASRNMIISKTTMFNLWHRCACGWCLAFFLLGIELSFIHLSTGKNFVSWRWFFAAWLVVPGVFWLIGLTSGDSNRVMYNAILFGLFGCLPLILVLAIGGALIFILAGDGVIPNGVKSTVVVAAIAMVCLDSLYIRSRIVDSKFVEREFRIQSAIVQVNRDVVLPKTQSSSISKLGERVVTSLGRIVLPIAAVAYGFQAGLTASLGQLAVPLFISCITLPWAIHATAQYFAGIYLWIYRTRCIERRYKLPVLFGPSSR